MNSRRCMCCPQSADRTLPRRCTEWGMVHHSKMAVGTRVESGVNIGKLGLRSVQLAASVKGPADLGWEHRYVANHFVFDDRWNSYVPNRQPDHGGTTGTGDQENRSSQ